LLYRSSHIPFIPDACSFFPFLYDKAPPCGGGSNNFSELPINCQIIVCPTEQPMSEPTRSRFTALGNVIGPNYPDYLFRFGPTTNEYAALELLANSDPGLVPVPVFNDGTNSPSLLLQRYVLVLLYLSTTGDEWTAGRWLQGQAGEMTCDWSGVTCLDGSSIETLDRTYSTAMCRRNL
jgi:hypothetical protein